MEIIHISHAGPVVRLLVNGRYHTFEMHHYCGPIKLNADGETPSKRQWKESSDFWDVFDQWMKNGKKVDDSGRGIIE